MMKMDMYWCSNDKWYHWDEFGNQILNDDAPQEAKDSYAHYLVQYKKYAEYYADEDTEEDCEEYPELRDK